MFLVFRIPKVKSVDEAFNRVQDSSSSASAEIAEIEPFMSTSVGIRTVLDCSSQEFGVRVLTLGKFLRFVPPLRSIHSTAYDSHCLIIDFLILLLRPGIPSEMHFIAMLLLASG